ncbi:10361_t:CDS:1, partial [Racocetra persica]
MAAIYGNNGNTDFISNINDVEETNKLKKYRDYLWKTDNMQPKAKWEDA